MARNRHEGQRLDGVGEVHDQVEAAQAATGGSPRRTARRLLLFGIATLGVVVVGVALLARGGDGPSSTLAADLDRCRGRTGESARACYERAFTAAVAGRDDPRPAVEEIGAAAWRERGLVLATCHGIMHTVGRGYAREAGVTLATLMDYLPRSNDPGCGTGFAHGLVTAVAPLIDPRRPRAAAAVCADAGTRYRRYSCIHGFGHAFMRINAGRLAPALALCKALGAQAAPDCAQGAYHDYWFAVVGADDAPLAADAVTDPRKLCAAQPPAFVRPCWYRAFVDNRPDGFVVSDIDDVAGLCDGLVRLQRQACVTAAAVIGPADPALQLELCASMRAASDAASCVRGTKVQNLLGVPTTEFVRLIGGCERFASAARDACYRWLGKTLTVVTDGSFARDGCPVLGTPSARRDCRAGAGTADDALVTFS